LSCWSYVWHYRLALRLTIL